MRTVKRILAATDFSRGAESAVRRALVLGRTTGAAVELVHCVYRPPLEEVWRKLAEAEGYSDDDHLNHAAERLSALSASLEKRLGLAPIPRVLRGKAPRAVAERARETGADLIVIGAHGEHFLLDLFVGTTALKILRLTSVPVLLVKQTPAFDYERVLVSTDFSPAARAAANLVAALLPEAELFLFHAYEVPFEREMYYASADSEVIDSYRRLGEAEARRQIEAFAATLDAPERFRRQVRHGYAPALIKQHAAEIGADLLVMGSHGQSELTATLLGSVAAHVVAESPGDLLLVPMADGAATA